ncbi:hypothetical protein CCR75_008074 [Bremia lactucae]|uniref:Uncharacterized protein n=1 Tax=Bremia lactucae TaxID=4779 RepID=A0A976IL90_BRELC|nr:hypothetical protein CCR75_008074 [Bremia lactucae]
MCSQPRLPFARLQMRMTLLQRLSLLKLKDAKVLSQWAQAVWTGSAMVDQAFATPRSRTFERFKFNPAKYDEKGIRWNKI